MATYNGIWIVFRARDGEVFRDFCPGRAEQSDAILDAAAKLEARGIDLSKVRMSIEDAAIEFSPKRRLSKLHFFQHSRDRSHLPKAENGNKRKFAPKDRQKGSRRDRREKRVSKPK